MIALLRYWREGLAVLLLMALGVQTLRLSWAENEVAEQKYQVALREAVLIGLAEDHERRQAVQKRELEAARRQSKADQPKIDRLRVSASKPDVEGACEISETLKGSLPL